MKDKTQLYSSLVWILGGLSLSLYGVLLVFEYGVLGVVEVVDLLSSLDGRLIIIAAFFTILIEGLYFIGSFFPGASTVGLMAMLSGLQSWSTFFLTIASIFIGWVIAGIINIFIATKYRAVLEKVTDDNFVVEDKTWATWFPAFRANYEVAQIFRGAEPSQVFWSSVRVKVWGSLGAGLVAAILPMFMDIQNMSNEEGANTLFAIAAITFVVGYIEMRKYLKSD